MKAFTMLVAVSIACRSSSHAPPADATDVDPDIPPVGSDQMATWIASGYYKDWTCEPAPHAQVYPSNHGMNRTCNNAILHADATGDGPFPDNAASVKELYDDAGVTIIGYAVSRKLTQEPIGSNWYWYQAGGAPPKDEDGTGESVNDCIGCHQCAPRDFTYAIVGVTPD
jgi:hypothetical protein